MEENTKFKNQNIILENRSKLSITGVLQVESFNENTIVLKTVKGGITIKGDNLNVGKLNIEDGNVIIQGSINEIIYNNKDSQAKGNFIGKLFK